MLGFTAPAARRIGLAMLAMVSLLGLPKVPAAATPKLRTATSPAGGASRPAP